MAEATFLTEAVRTLTSDQALLEPVKVLEAGCGSTSHVDWPFERSIVGIDIDRKQLDLNDSLDRKILGDLQTHELPAGEFDLAVCVDVLEHIPDPEAAFKNIAKSVRIGGYILIGGPEPYSYKGFAAKHTPPWVRPLIFRLLTGKPHTVLLVDGVHRVFFPTFLRPFCSHRRLLESAASLHLSVVYDNAYDAHSESLAGWYKPFVGLVKVFTRWIETLTGGKVNLLLADYVVLLRKEY